MSSSVCDRFNTFWIKLHVFIASLGADAGCEVAVTEPSLVSSTGGSIGPSQNQVKDVRTTKNVSKVDRTERHKETAADRVGADNREVDIREGGEIRETKTLRVRMKRVISRVRRAKVRKSQKMMRAELVLLKLS